MSSEASTLGAERVVTAVHGRRTVAADPVFETGLRGYLRERYTYDGLVELYGRYLNGEGALDVLMRRAIFAAAAGRAGAGLQVAGGVNFKHLDTFDIGDGVFIGAQTYLQGRFDGRCVIGRNVWIGPGSYFDARDLVIEDSVGWGPGAKVLGSEHTGEPVSVPIIQTDLRIRPVRIGAWADIGVNAVILPGVTIGRGAIVGAGAIVTHDVADGAVVAGVPARFIRWRTDAHDEAARVETAAGAER
ncbi:MAG TPA: acyltransferase [Vicinamibacterales bacterium]|nr:acyltransferase [Vicinamibacterales bacterium]